MKKIFIPLIFLIALSYACVVYAGRGSKWFPFNKADALKEWDEKIFKDRVLYRVEVQKKSGFLSAYSQNSCSGIFYRISFDPKKYPMVSWKWKVIKFPDKSKVSSLEGKWLEKDDYAARVYVIFPSFFFSKTKCLEYVWDKDLKEGTILTNPYLEYIKIIVAQSGEKELGQWVLEERNIYDDYIKAFGNKPGSVGAIAIMTDTDNTISSAEAHYDEIEVGYKK